ncbi:hypothetical protein [Herbaspirillum lusitanum]|uniref:hypothetical protein n=1 Tax=Herbaspirillum lusitanum TaxID=213312 RepID=UPI0012F49C77|nr:hypothetical protein [Herbaspirillum lusitanum]
MKKNNNLWLLGAAVILIIVAVLVVSKNYNEILMAVHFKDFEATVSGKDRVPDPSKTSSGETNKDKEKNSAQKPEGKSAGTNTTSGANSPIIENVHAPVTVNYGKN